MGKRIGIALGLACLVAGAGGSAFAGKGNLFEGGWESTDTGDQSNQWIWITNYSGVHEILAFDDLCSGCTGVQGVGPSCLVVGSGRLDGETTLVMDSGVVTCYWQEGPEVLLTDYSDTYIYGNGVVSDSWGNEWVRSKDKPVKTIRPTLMPKLLKPEFNGDLFLSSVMSDPRFDGGNCDYLGSSGNLPNAVSYPPGTEEYLCTISAYGEPNAPWIGVEMSATDADGPALSPGLLAASEAVEIANLETLTEGWGSSQTFDMTLPVDETKWSGFLNWYVYNSFGEYLRVYVEVTVLPGTGGE